MGNEKPEIVGGPMAHALAWMVQQMQEESGSSDLVLVETDADGNELRRVKLTNAKLLRVEVAEESDVVEYGPTLRYDKLIGGDDA